MISASRRRSPACGMKPITAKSCRRTPPDREPIGVALPGTVRAVVSLGHDALEPSLLRRIEQGEAILGDRFHHVDTRRRADRLAQARAAPHPRLAGPGS